MIQRDSTKRPLCWIFIIHFQLQYKDGPLLPPLNFTATCLKQGRYVTFYNERIERVRYPEGYQINAVYTELCEVIVEGNKALKGGLFSYMCHIYCPPPENSTVAGYKR